MMRSLISAYDPFQFRHKSQYSIGSPKQSLLIVKYLKYDLKTICLVVLMRMSISHSNSLISGTRLVNRALNIEMSLLSLRSTKFLVRPSGAPISQDISTVWWEPSLVAVEICKPKSICRANKKNDRINFTSAHAHLRLLEVYLC